VTAALTTGRFARREVRRWLNLSERQLRSWERQGLIAPAEAYGFRELIALRSLVKLRRDRVPPLKLQRAIRALRARLREVEDPLVDVKLFSEGGQIRVQVGGCSMEPVTGQLLLDFGAEELRKLVRFPEPKSEPAGPPAPRAAAAADRLFEEGVRLEQAGEVEEARQSYRRALEADPNHTGALINLGTIHFTAREFGQAREYYERAVAADPDNALARFNLANVFEEMGLRLEALVHYQAALKLAPDYADAHYNLALLYQTIGQPLRAVRHWRIYLRLDPGSPWAAIARRELDRIYRETVVESGEPRS
jgi:tetratricopeptide (TPR) repeat protein